jgi:hypothetical protein
MATAKKLELEILYCWDSGHALPAALMPDER